MKNRIHAQLKMIEQLSDISKEIAKNILKNIPSADAELISILSHTEALHADKVMEFMKRYNYIDDSETDYDITIPEINIHPDTLFCDMTVPVDGGKLSVFNSCSDNNTQQMGIGYLYGEDGDFIDLALTEVKRGELAVIDGLPEDNKDIDLYVYSDPHDEDYTEKIHIAFNDIAEALSCDEESIDDE